MTSGHHGRKGLNVETEVRAGAAAVTTGAIAANGKEGVIAMPKLTAKRRLALIARRRKLAREIEAGLATTKRLTEREDQIRKMRQWGQHIRQIEDFQCLF